MKETMMTALMLFGTPAFAQKTRVLELRVENRDDKNRLKQDALEQHKGLGLIREREKSDVGYVKSSAAKPETIHDGLLEVHEKSRRDRLALRQVKQSERRQLRKRIRERRAEIAALRKKK